MIPNLCNFKLLQDPRESLIVSLRREVEALQNENDHLRKALDITKKSSASISSESNFCQFTRFKWSLIARENLHIFIDLTRRFDYGQLALRLCIYTIYDAEFRGGLMSLMNTEFHDRLNESFISPKRLPILYRNRIVRV